MLIRIRRNRSGQAIVIMALAMVGICGMLALAIDAGRLYFQRRLMQDAVDAGALAGAHDTAVLYGLRGGWRDRIGCGGNAPMRAATSGGTR